MASKNSRAKPSRKVTADVKPKLTGGIAFEIQLEENLERPRSAGPGRLRQLGQREPITLEDVQEKQRRAEERRKAAEAEKLQKIHVKEEVCNKVSHKKDNKQRPGDTQNQGPTKPFDENEVVPALKKKLGEQKPTVTKNSKSSTSNKKPSSKLQAGKGARKS